jgi:hypothetical protein
MLRRFLSNCSVHMCMRVCLCVWLLDFLAALRCCHSVASQCLCREWKYASNCQCARVGICWPGRIIAKISHVTAKYVLESKMTLSCAATLPAQAPIQSHCDAGDRRRLHLQSTASRSRERFSPCDNPRAAEPTTSTEFRHHPIKKTAETDPTYRNSSTARQCQSADDVNFIHNKSPETIILKTFIFFLFHCLV